ncbi:TRAP transporter substrate-binding protein DctP [Roseovarius sp. CAU 1744]|uniref:TRAP transporter substrate-binding protein n=1 Tax=Roseovarius sp. CAU 1744 TaxID=3140368 RepID=UPI00325AC77F
MTITRRKLLQKTGYLGGVALLATHIPGSAHAASTITGVFYIPQSYKALSAGANGFVEQLKSHAAGQFAVEYYDSGTLLKADEQLAALRAGSIDFMFHTSSYITRSVKILGITGLPGVVAALHENPGRIARGSALFNLVNEELAKENIYLLTMMGNIYEPEYLWSTADKPIRSIADIAGKKIRVVSFEATQLVERFGGVAVRIPSSELYLALQRGTVDAAVANISTIVGRSLQEQIGHVYRLPITAYGIGLFVDLRRWQKLPQELKTAMESASDWADVNGAAMANNDIYPNELWPIIQDAGIEKIDPSKEDLSMLETAAEDVTSAWKDDVGHEIGTRAVNLALGSSS